MINCIDWPSAVLHKSVQWEPEAEYWVGNRRLLQHVQRLEYTRGKHSIDRSNIDINGLFNIAYLCSQFDMNAEAEAMYLEALPGFEKAWGAEHTSTLKTVTNLGCLYVKQGKMAEAEAMYLRALQGLEKALRWSTCRHCTRLTASAACTPSKVRWRRRR